MFRQLIRPTDYLALEEMEAVKAFKSNPELSKWKRRERERVECREGETNGRLSNRNKSARCRWREAEREGVLETAESASKMVREESLERSNGGE